MEMRQLGKYKIINDDLRKHEITEDNNIGKALITSAKIVRLGDLKVDLVEAFNTSDFNKLADIFKRTKETFPEVFENGITFFNALLEDTTEEFVNEFHSYLIGDDEEEDEPNIGEMPVNAPIPLFNEAPYDRDDAGDPEPLFDVDESKTPEEIEREGVSNLNKD